MENFLALKLKGLREKQKLSLQELADRIGVAKQSIHKFENGVITPSSETLLKISDVLNIPYSAFYEKPYKELRDIQFREKHKISNPVLEQEIKDEVCKYLSKFIELSSIMDEENEFQNPLDGFEIATDKDIEKAAKLIRKKWKIGYGPIVDVVETLESNRVFVVEIDRVEDFTGLSGMIDDRIPVIVLNEHIDIVERKRFTALHELGHIVLEFSEEISERRLERYCDMFAGAILLIDEVLYNELGKNRTVITLAELKRIKELYGISIQAIIMRASTSGLIDTQTSDKWWQSYKEWNSDESKKSSFGGYRSLEKPQRFKSLLARGVAEKRVSMSKAAALTDKKVDVIRKELEELCFNVRM